MRVWPGEFMSEMSWHFFNSRLLRLLFEYDLAVISGSILLGARSIRCICGARLLHVTDAILDYSPLSLYLFKEKGGYWSPQALIHRGFVSGVLCASKWSSWGARHWGSIRPLICSHQTGRTKVPGLVYLSQALFGNLCVFYLENFRDSIALLVGKF